MLAKVVPVNDRCRALMLTAMRNATLRRLLISVLLIFAAFAAGTGMYAVALAWWPLVLVWWPWLLAGAVGVVALGAWWLWWRLPKRQVDRLRLTIRDPKSRADVEDDFRKTVGQLLLAAAALVGAGLAYLQFTEQQGNTQQQFAAQQDASRKQFEEQQKASRDLLMSNQVAKGFELLGNKDKDMMQRLGGIYALEGVMNTSEQYHQPVLEALCAFVRERTKTETGEGPPADDIQAALTVIGRRKSKFNERSLRLENAHIHYADLRGAYLSGAVLSGANLSSAVLWDADLSGALFDDSNLSGADLGGAKITQAQLDKACGTDVKLDPGLTIKPCQ